MKSDAIQKFWKDFCETEKINPEMPYQFWYLGDTSEMARKLAAPVFYARRGGKRRGP